MKRKVLAYCDTPTIKTGFGIVAKHILKGLQDTGLYDIDVLGINYFGDFFSKEEYPYQIVPAKLSNPNEPFGMEMLLKAVTQKEYDYLFVINDIYVTQPLAQSLESVVKQHRPNLKIIYYYPVDCKVREEMASFIKLAHVPVTYTQYGYDETIKVLPELKNKLKVVYHGVDNIAYYKLVEEGRVAARNKFFGVTDPETRIFINVNRNSLRKDLARTIYAFSEYRKKVPNSVLYLHTSIRDQGLDLSVPCKELGLSITKDVLFPKNYNLVQAFPEKVLNEMYNAADAYITTSLGEGWGLSTTEAMAAGTPVIAPRHTSFVEMVGETKGFLYDCKEKTYLDNSGFRPVAHIVDIVDMMLEATGYLNADAKYIKEKTTNASVFAHSIDWTHIQKIWVDIFEEAFTAKPLSVMMDTI